MLKLKRIVFSLSLVGFSFLTMIATTFAWVGITSNSVFDEFSINLKTDNDTGNYGIQLSLTGRDNSFSDSIDGISIRRQLLKNTGLYDENMINKANDDKINALFLQYEMDQCTPASSTGVAGLFNSNDLQSFENVLTHDSTRGFMYFDIYAALYVAKTTGNPSENTTPISIFLRDSLLSSDEIGEWNLHNPYTYPNSQILIKNEIYNSPFANQTINGKIRVNPASAARVCIQKFEPTPLELTPTHLSDSKGYKIYQYDDNLPYYDSVNKVYSFGGILPSEHNMAQQQFLLANLDATIPSVPQWQIDRGDEEYKDEANIGRIVDESDNLTVGKKIKFRVYFWFEGWDADCFEVIDKRKVRLNLSFSNKAPYDV